MAKSKDHRQDEIPGMESPKDPKIERAGRKWLQTKAELGVSRKSHASSFDKLRELMHAGEKVGAVRRLTDKGKDFLIYARENINVRIEIKETAKVLLDDDAAAELTEEGGEDEETAEVQVSE